MDWSRCHAVIMKLNYKCQTCAVVFFRVTKVYQESKELREIGVLVKPVQRFGHCTKSNLSIQIIKFYIDVWNIQIDNQVDTITITGRTWVSWNRRPPWSSRRGWSTRAEGKSNFVWEKAYLVDQIIKYLFYSFNYNIFSRGSLVCRV